MDAYSTSIKTEFYYESPIDEVTAKYSPCSIVLVVPVFR